MCVCVHTQTPHRLAIALSKNGIVKAFDISELRSHSDSGACMCLSECVDVCT